jgi:hypothetical protein
MSPADRFLAAQEAKAQKLDANRAQRAKSRAMLNVDRATWTELRALADAAKMPLTEYADKLLAAHVRGMKANPCITRK